MSKNLDWEDFSIRDRRDAGLAQRPHEQCLHQAQMQQQQALGECMNSEL